MEFLTTLFTIGMIIAITIPGYIVRKLNMIPQGMLKPLIVVLMYINQPFLTIASFAQKSFEMRLLVNMGWTALLAVVLQLVIYGIAQLCFCKTKDLASKRACVITCYMSNCGFMGIPVLQALFPDLPELVIYCAVFLVIFNIFSWTLSVFTITGERKFISVKKAFLNPPTAALIVALPIFFTGFQLPAPILTSVEFLGDMTLPLSMLILGMRLADVKLSTLFTSLKVYLSVGIRLVISPLIGVGIMLLLRLLVPLDRLVILAMYVTLAMPTATASVMFAEMYQGDSATASKVVLLSSLLCVITMPLLLMLFDVMVI